MISVIATATRPESIAWARELGAEAIISHHEPLDEGLKAAGIGEVDYILCMNSTGQHFDAMCRAIAPQGTIASIVELSEPVNLGALMRKSARFVWELMFTRSLFQTADMDQQGIILAHIADLIDAQTLRARVEATLEALRAMSAAEHHALMADVAKRLHAPPLRRH